MLASLSMPVWSSGAHGRFSHTHPGLPMLLVGDSNVWLPPFQLGRSRQADSSLVPIIEEMMQSHSLVLRNPLDVPTHRCGAALDIILATRSLSCHVAVHCGSTCCSVAPLCCPLLASDHFLCSCRVNLPQFVPASPGHSSTTMPRVRDWSSVVASCHARLTEWHQFVLSLSSSPLPSTPQRVSALDAVFSSLTQILFVVPLSTHAGGPPPLHLAFAGGNPCGGTTLASAPSLLATAPGVTSVAQGRKRIALVSAFYVSSFTALCVLPGPASGVNGLTVCSPSPTGIPGWRPPSFDAPSERPQPLPICAI